MVQLFVKITHFKLNKSIFTFFLMANYTYACFGKWELSEEVIFSKQVRLETTLKYWLIINETNFAWTGNFQHLHFKFITSGRNT